MPNNRIESLIIQTDISLRDAMKKLDDTHRKILFVTQVDNTLFGSLTDGDIRRWILAEGSLEKSVRSVCNPTPFSIGVNYELDDVKQMMLQHKIQAVPVVDEKHQIQDLIFWDTAFSDDNIHEEKEPLDISVVIMAGGAGTRLDPFTRILPKPLIPIGDRSIMEVIIEKFREYGINEYYVSLYSKAKLIRAYFDEVAPPYKLIYLEENEPLGTVGILSKIKDIIKGSLILTNCDTIINCDYKDLVDFHEKNKFDITLVGSLINHKIPYGICEIAKEGKLVNLTEKPEYSYLVSTGMYVLRNTALKLIPENERFNMPDLIEKVRNTGGDVGVYPISEKSWLDTGEWHEYKKTVEQLSL
ncbi:MAG: NTP transferase domain-containing protein [Bacteroidetes bacterium]|jgi:dTDP-glucose pyrophosphorylase|nr:NTP transferase domain-containing protein [Bacteroidota bacterium]